MIRHSRTPIFPEFARRSLSSLLWERAQSQAGIRRDQCEQAFAVAEHLEVSTQVIVGPINWPAEIARAEQLRGHLQNCIGR